MKKRTVENELNFRNAVRERDNWTCQKCGSVEYPQAHHIEPGNNNPENGITLCVYCHADEHPEVPRQLFVANAMKAEKEGCISVGALAKELGVHPRTVVRRARGLGILKTMQKWVFTTEEAELLCGYERPKERNSQSKEKDLKHIKLELPNEVFRWLKKKSAKAGMSISFYLTKLIENEKNFFDLTEKGVFFAEGL